MKIGGGGPSIDTSFIISISYINSAVEFMAQSFMWTVESRFMPNTSAVGGKINNVHAEGIYTLPIQNSTTLPKPLTF